MIANPGCFVHEDLSRFLLGRLPENEAVQVSRHLASCGRCLDAAGHVAAVDPLVDAMRAQSGPADSLDEEPVEALVMRMSKLLVSFSSGGGSPTVTGGGTGESTFTLATECNDFLAPPASPDEIGRLGPYRVLSRIGSGGMGIVYRAEEAALNRLVALKVMRPALAASESARLRFLREAQAAASIRNDHVVAIHRVGEDRGIPYLAMPLLRGESLEARIRRIGALPPVEVARIGREIAEALVAAHASGLIHRDLKPDNIWLEGEEGRVVVLDFGLARPIGGDSSLSVDGALIGTPSYMAPEQANGDPLDHRCDLFSLGSVLYAMCTGKPPFWGRSDLATVRLVSEQPAPSITALNPRVPDALVRLIEALHAKDPERRPESAVVVAEELGRCELGFREAAPRPARKRGTLWAVAACGLFGLAALAGLGQGSWRFVRFSSPTPAAPVQVAEPAAPDRQPAADAEAKANAEVYPAAILPFEERGADVKALGAQTSDILFARLTATPKLLLVDRAELDRTLQEQELNLSGMVKEGGATRVGQLTGAKLLITGSVFQVDKTIYVVAKVISTETGRTLGASIRGRSSDEFGPLVETLAGKIAEAVEKEGHIIVTRPAPVVDRVAAVKRALPKADRPSVCVTIVERHVGVPTIDPAAETELVLFCKETGFTVLDTADQEKADILIRGEGFSEFAGRHGNLVSVKARVEVKAIDRKTGNVLAVDRQTVRAVDLAEQVAGKSALQEAAAVVAERVLPKLVKK